MHPIVFRVGVIVKNAPSTLKGCIVSICGTQAILRNQIDTIPKSELSFFEYTKTPMVRAFSVMSDAPS